MPTPSQEPEEFDAAFESIEQQLSLFWRRARAVSHTISRSLHPEIEPGAYGLLMILQREGPLRVTELAALIGIGKPSVSRQVALLEQIGLVVKEDDPSDRRAQRVTLSPAGAAEVEELRRRRLSFFRDALGSWDLADLSSLAGYFSRVNADLATAGRRRSESLRHTQEGPGVSPAPPDKESVTGED
ncbi:MarR family winged helix-turn-helix transcriptional regulator [Sinomonas terrae]|uniref:MarR family transcriptional regulator n=1 Tax=Sinomonas terrae TaxID=2908838 RepID=A0ABS9U2G6_9MICC|nr:MarR family transcriptional regulator [Sinomonas terrae]MCH6470893.1 MarR family transcriptional regulator [Sinomonas terrae]